MEKDEQGAYPTMKGHPAGVIPCCIGAEDGVGYVLIGEQNYWPLISREDVKGDTGEDVEHTAAREGFEESSGVLGAVDFLLEMLYDVNARDMIFPGGFMVGYGTLTKAERDYLVDLHAKKLMTTLNPIKREMKQLRWFKITDIRDAIVAFGAANDNSQEVHVIGMPKGTFLRHFFKFDLTWVHWNSGVVKMLCDGIYPFPKAKDRYSEWKQNKWRPEERK